MSLKSFHIFFILVASLFFGGFAVWCFRVAGGTAGQIMGTSSLVALVGLACYLAWMLKKLKHLSYLMLPLAVLASESATACAVCYGDPNSPLVQSANTAVFFMLGIVAVMLSSFGGLFLFWRRNSKRLTDSASAASAG